MNAEVSVAREAEAGPGPIFDAPDPLTDDDRDELQQNEQTIRSHHEQGYLAVGRALSTIQQRRLYRETHPSFEKYAQARLQMTKVTAYRLIGAVKVVEELHAAARQAGVTNLVTPREGTIRPLVKLSDDKRQQVIGVLLNRVQMGFRLCAAQVRHALCDANLAECGPRRRSSSTCPWQRKLENSEQEELAHDAADLVCGKNAFAILVLKRAVVLAERRAKR